MNDDIGIALGVQLERIANALEAIHAIVKPSDLATFHQEAPRTAPEPRQTTSGPVDPEPPFPGPSPEFRQSRDLPPEPFVNLATWSCPIHHSSKTVPAGVSKRTGKPYEAFIACAEMGCNEKPPRPFVRR